jgi:hypothetical protein
MVFIDLRVFINLYKSLGTGGRGASSRSSRGISVNIFSVIYNIITSNSCSCSQVGEQIISHFFTCRRSIPAAGSRKIKNSCTQPNPRGDYVPYDCHYTCSHLGLASHRPRSVWKLPLPCCCQPSFVQWLSSLMRCQSTRRITQYHQLQLYYAAAAVVIDNY